MIDKTPIVVPVAKDDDSDSEDESEPDVSPLDLELLQKDLDSQKIYLRSLKDNKRDKLP